MFDQKQVSQNLNVLSLSSITRRKRQLNQLCAVAIEQQIKRNESENTHHRKRRRYLAKQVLKRVSLQQHRSNNHWLHSITLVLALWGFNGLVAPSQALAADFGGDITSFDIGKKSAPTFADIDGDGDLDAFVGEYYGTVKFHRNEGTNLVPRFVVDADANPLGAFNVGIYAAPTFVDIDNDGDLDAFVGAAEGIVNYYRNDGTEVVPSFVSDVAGNPLNGFDVGTDSSPSFADIDGDGDLDAFVGERSGTVKYYRNDGTDQAPNFVADGAGNPLNGVALTYNTSPTFADIDGDGDLDAFVGDNNSVKYYRNDGTFQAPNFVADGAGNPLDGLAVPYGYATPAFADIDDDGDLDAFTGESEGIIRHYRNDGTHLAPNFVADIADNPLSGVDVSNYASVVLVDIDNDGDLDAFIGHYDYGVNYYRNDGIHLAPEFVADVAGNPLGATAGIYYTAPAFVDIDNDGDLDAFVGEYYGTVKYYRNDGTQQAPNFVADAAGNPLNGVAVGYYAAPTFADIDNDGDLDAFIGDENGTVTYYRNDGTTQAPNFVADVVGNPLDGVDVGRNSAPTFVDIDGDDDLDAYIGEAQGTLKYYRNDGTKFAPSFVADNTGNPLTGFGALSDSRPAFADIDGDDDFDLFVANGFGNVLYFKNIDGPIPSVDIQDEPTSVNNTDAFSLTIEFSVDVTGFDSINDVTVVNGNVDSVTTVDGNTYTVSITPDGGGDISIDVAKGVATSVSADVNNAAATQAVVSFDASEGSGGGGGGGGALNLWSLMLLPILTLLRRKKHNRGLLL